jgi:uncharacterized membrane protein
MLLTIHVILGFIGLTAGIFVLFLKKGNQLHKKIGSVFLYAMLLSALAALLLSYFRSNVFLFAIGIFTLYLIGTGSRYIQLKATGSLSAKPKMVDWVLSGLMLVSGIGLVVLGISSVVRGNMMGLVLVVFGSIGLSGVWQDLRYYRGLQKEKMYWLSVHISRMVGGFIAATTAFLVNNTQHLPAIPSFIYWLLPTAILVPLIIKWQQRYIPKKKNQLR